MIKTFKNNGKVAVFDVTSGKASTVVESNGLCIINPTIEQIEALGWQECIQENNDVYIPSIEELVEKKIREKYSINQEFQIQRKRDLEPEQFYEYYQYVEQCINEARNQKYKQEQLKQEVYGTN